MTNEMKISYVQMNPTVGDIGLNTSKILSFYEQALGEATDLVIFPEFSIGGYPPEDLVSKPAFQEKAIKALENLALKTKNNKTAMLVGGPRIEPGKLYNSFFLLDGGEVKTYRDKQCLPNYGVFDEKRVFDKGTPQGPINFRGMKIGLMICEDMWFPDVAETLMESGAEILLAPQASPFAGRKSEERLQQGIARVTETGFPLIVLNQVGGQDELVFDGSSFVLDKNCMLTCQLPSFKEVMISQNWIREGGYWVPQRSEIHSEPNFNESLYQALVLGLRDYVTKNRFPGVLIGLSGGVDSALTASIAVDAIGKDKVHTIMMPSRYTSEDSLKDAKDCSEFLGVHYDIIEIESMVKSFSEALAPSFKGYKADTTEENIQARVRGVILMAQSNKFGHMVIATGNKSEMSVGYSTLYGDLCGGFAVLKDLYKTKAFELCHWRNENYPKGALGPSGRVIPENTITKPPTAELRGNQKDEDNLPPYDVLDDILESFIEYDLSVEDIIKKGHDKETVARVEHMLYIAEYKRRQAPPGVKITPRLFGRERRYPITNGFRNADK
ncbi:MAG: NAD+ synthase [Sphingomonadales bacterium]